MTDADQDAAARRRNIESIYPLAPLQEGILFHTLLAPQDSGVYMPQMAYFLRGGIDPAALRAAWEEVLARHSALRTAVRWEERDAPFQVVYRTLPLRWEERDWRGEDGDAKLRQLFEANRADPFDLRRPPLMRLCLARLEDERHVMVICHHHIVLDGWSNALMLQDVMTIFAGGAPPAARPYADYIRWLKRQDTAAAHAFWRDYLADAPGPSIAFGGAGAAPMFARREWAFPDDLAAATASFCADRGVTLNTLLQGVLGLAVAERLGRTDVLFGSATSGRPATLPGATGMVGLFINALPARIRLDPAESVGQWLQRLQAQQAETIEHEHVALRDIQAGQGALFDCLLVVENYPVTVGDGAKDVVLERVEFDEWTHFPLTLLVAPGHAGMKLILRHDLTVVSAADLEAFLARYVAILETVVGAAERSIEEIVGPLADVKPAAPTVTPEGAPRPPEGETEEAVAAIWAEVLKSERPHATDNFFAIGGHSLLAAKVATRLRRDLDVDIAVRAMFDRPILADLAIHIDALRAGGAAEGEYVVEF